VVRLKSETATVAGEFLPVTITGAGEYDLNGRLNVE
jgi:hypothetical protein